MPRSIQDILDHADELAKRFEDFDPTQGRDVRSRSTCFSEPSSHEHAANSDSSNVARQGMARLSCRRQIDGANLR